MFRYVGYRLGKIRATDADRGGQMTLDEAIEHAEEVARTCDDSQCAADHMQLAKWLRMTRGIDEAETSYTEKIRKLEAQNKWLRRECTSLRKSREREFAASCEAATNSMGQIGTLRDKNAELRDENERLRELVRDMWRDGMCECDELRVCPRGEYHCAKCEYHYPDRMRELGIEADDD